MSQTRCQLSKAVRYFDRVDDLAAHLADEHPPDQQRAIEAEVVQVTAWQARRRQARRAA